MDSITDTIKRNLEEYGRVHWLLENTQTRTARLVEALERFKREHPVSALSADGDGETLIAYSRRENGWAIETRGWRDLETGKEHPDEARPIISAYTTTKNATVIGRVHLRLSDAQEEAQALFGQLVGFLHEQFSSATIRDMLAGQEDETKEKAPHDPWANCHIHETFVLPVKSAWLASTMKEAGELLERKGTESIDSYTLYHVPELVEGKSGADLAWAYTYNYWLGSKSVAISWSITDTEIGASVETCCTHERFRSYYYRLKDVARQLAAKKQAETQPAKQPAKHADTPTRNHKGSIETGKLTVKAGGRPTLLCNYWAYAQSVLEHSADSIFPGWAELYKWETGKDATELTDPLESMKKGMTAVGKKHRKK